MSPQEAVFTAEDRLWWNGHSEAPVQLGVMLQWALRCLCSQEHDVRSVELAQLMIIPVARAALLLADLVEIRCSGRFGSYWRTATGEHVGDKTTFLQHLRAAHSKLIGEGRSLPESGLSDIPDRHLFLAHGAAHEAGDVGHDVFDWNFRPSS